MQSQVRSHPHTAIVSTSRPLTLLLICALLVALFAPGRAFARMPYSTRAEEALASSLLHRAPAQVAEIAPGVVLPLWRGSDGKLLAIVASGQASNADSWRAPLLGGALNLRAVDASPLLTETLRYQFDNGLRAEARMAQRSWTSPGCMAPLGLSSGACVDGRTALGGVTTAELGAGYARGPLDMALSLGLSRPSNLGGPLGTPTLSPLYGGGALAGLPLDLMGSATQLSASSGLALGGLRFELGASYGRVDTNPTLLPGFGGLNEKSLRLGVAKGAITGVVTGRVITPGNAAGLGLDLQSWTTVDLGITWRLPWHGALSVGAQNLWSQGAPPPGANVPGAAARVPYVQYQQDL